MVIMITEMTNTLMTGRALVETEPIRYQLEEIQLSLDKERLEKVEHHHIQGKCGGTVEKECGCCLTNELLVLLRCILAQCSWNAMESPRAEIGERRMALSGEAGTIIMIIIIMIRER